MSASQRRSASGQPVSYYTIVTFEFSDEPPDAEAVWDVARRWLDAEGCYAADDLREDFVRGWTEGQTQLKGLVSFDIEGLMSAISAQYPTIRFFVRGLGEEFEDTWLRSFEAGEIVFKVGPFAPSND